MNEESLSALLFTPIIDSTDYALHITQHHEVVYIKYWVKSIVTCAIIVRIIGSSDFKQSDVDEIAGQVVGASRGWQQRKHIYITASGTACVL